MSDPVIVCTTQVEAIAIAAKLNAGSRSVATLADRKGTGLFVPVDQVVTERFTQVIRWGNDWIVPVPNIPARRALLSAAERARTNARTAPARP